MKISHKLIGSFTGIALLTGVVGAVAIAQSQRIAEDLAIAEAEHVAQTLAISIVHDSYYDNRPISIERSEELRDYTNLLHRLQNRDVAIVDRQKLIIADAVPEEIGTVFNHDQGNEVQQTIQDGITRTFLEESDDDPQGINLIVVPLKAGQNQIVGAVILEYSSLYDKAIAQARPMIIVIGITSLGCVVLAVFAGLRIASSIASPLQSLTEMSQQVTQTSNFDLQAPVTTQDETGVLAIAINHLIRQVKVLLTEQEQRSEELQQTLDQLHKTQLQLVQTEKMSSLGQLVAGIAHEINNPINFIHGNISHVDSYTQDLLKVIQAYQAHYPHPPQTLQASLAEAELDFLTEDVVNLLRSMQVGTERIREIVLSLRNFSRLDEVGFKAVDIHEGIDNTLVILHHRLKAKAERPEIKIIKEYGQLPLVECQAGQLNQAFMNILSNAIDAFEELNRGKSFQEIAAHPNTIQVCTSIIDQQRVAVAIIDNGPGITEQVRSRLFDPFFTTKPVGKGTGLGLSISYQVVTEKHGGRLWCDSTPGQGTKFVIEIPLRQKKLAR